MSILRTQTRITGPSTGGEMVSIQHWVGEETVDPEVLEQQAEEARDRLTAAWGQVDHMMVAGVTVFPAETVTVLDTVPPQFVPLAPPGTVSGTSALHALPWATQGIITLRDGSAQRSGRGRVFIPYVAEDSNDEGVPTGAAVASFNLFADALAAPLGITPLQLALYHRATETATIVGTAQARSYWAYLGSRRD